MKNFGHKKLKTLIFNNSKGDFQKKFKKYKIFKSKWWFFPLLPSSPGWITTARARKITTRNRNWAFGWGRAEYLSHWAFILDMLDWILFYFFISWIGYLCGVFLNHFLLLYLFDKNPFRTRACLSILYSIFQLIWAAFSKAAWVFYFFLLPHGFD